jgi:carboxymethylenebutenolidase
MGTKVTLTAADGFEFGAYRADPAGPVRGGVVVIQEIFGVNHHIRSICDRLADTGYRAIAPQVFDRVEPDFESGYSVPEVTYARELAGRVDWAKMMIDVSAAIDALKSEGPVAVMGFCMGGSVAFLAATRFGGLAAAICYYGGQIARNADRKPKCPVQMHFGGEDEHIPPDDVEAIRQKRPECEIHVYPGAGHAFNNDERSSYDLRSAAISWQRSLALLTRVFASAKARKQGAGAPLPLRTAVPVAVTTPEPKKPVVRKPAVNKPIAEKPAAQPASVRPGKKKPAARKPKPAAPKPTAPKPAAPKAVARKPKNKSPASKPAAKPPARNRRKRTPEARASVKTNSPQSQVQISAPKKSGRKRKAKTAPARAAGAKRRAAAKAKRNAASRALLQKSRPPIRPRPAAKAHGSKPKPKPKPRQRPKPEPKPKLKLEPGLRPAPKPKPKARPRPRAKAEPQRRMWGFALFSSPNYRRGRF